MTASFLHFVVLLCTLPRMAIARAGAASNLTLRSRGVAKEMQYTQNSLCRQNNCVNPIFPGLDDLPRLEALTWQCSDQGMVKEHMGFCKDAVMYDPALPSPVTVAKSVSELVKAQDDAAMTMFVYHLSGMGYDAWDYQQPSQSDNDCVRSIWKMVCYTYFPRANAGCKAGQASLFQRPCQSSCHNYLQHCGVECCDESVQCTFAHTKTNQQGQVELVATGYVAQDGPSAQCTGGARRSHASPMLLILALFGMQWLASAESSGSSHTTSSRKSSAPRLSRYAPLMVLFAGCAMCLQGCASISRHEIGNWRSMPNYLSEYRFVPPNGSPKDAILNSCAVSGVAASLQCSGRGYCKAFSTTSVAANPDVKSLAFCSCEPGWADPECGTARKSQTTAFFLSVFLGMFGADYFYLGYPLWGLGKLFTLGGLGFWWLVDIIRVASGPVYAYNFRTANDLSHPVAMLFIFFLFGLLGFLLSIETYFGYRKKKRDDMAALQHAEEVNHFRDTKKDLMARDMKASYGAMQMPPMRSVCGGQQMTQFG